jgi:hypothetical protein
LVEDYVKRELGRLEEAVGRVAREMEGEEREREETLSPEKGRGLRGRIGRAGKAAKLLGMLAALERKRYLFFVVEQIRSFEEQGSTPPLHLDRILKQLLNLSKLLNQIESCCRNR